jgi:hypothetical protein
MSFPISIKELVTALNTWKENSKFVISRVIKDEKNRKQLSFLEGDVCNYFFYFTNDVEQSSGKVVEFYEKRGYCENYIKEAKYDIAVGHLLLQSFYPNEAVYQLMMLAYILFLLFKMGFAMGT